MQSIESGDAILKRAYPNLSNKRGEDTFRKRLALERRAKQKKKKQTNMPTPL